MAKMGQAASRLSPWWRNATILIMIAGFSVLSAITVLTYSNAPPIPSRVTDAGGRTLFDRQKILRGQEIFLKYGLMEHGTLWGHGAYLGPDYGAEYLHRLAEICNDQYARERSGRPFSGLTVEESEVAASLTRRELRVNRYDAATDTLVFTPARRPRFRCRRKSGRPISGGSRRHRDYPRHSSRHPRK